MAWELCTGFQQLSPSPKGKGKHLETLEFGDWDLGQGEVFCFWPGWGPWATGGMEQDESPHALSLRDLVMQQEEGAVRASGTWPL